MNFRIYEYPDVNPETRLAARMYLAELYFDLGTYTKVISLLETYFELETFTNHPIYDILHRLIFIIALFQRQLRRASIQIRKLEEKINLRNLIGLYDTIQSLKSIIFVNN